MSEPTELDRIINDGKVNSATAMVVFAVELKNQGQALVRLEQALKDDNARYVPITDFNAVEKRVARLENAGLKILGFVFLLVVAAVIGLVIKTGTTVHP